MDLSLTGTGIASYADRDLRVSTVVTGTARGAPRVRLILRSIARACANPAPGVVVLEGAVAGKNGATTLALGELHGVVKYWLAVKDIPYALVPPAVLKKYVLGKGGGDGTGKDAMVLAVDRRYGHLVRVLDHNGADAVGLLAAACDWYGGPLAPVPKPNRAALLSVRWPDLRPGDAGIAPAAPARTIAPPAMPAFTSPQGALL